MTVLMLNSYSTLLNPTHSPTLPSSPSTGATPPSPQSHLPPHPIPTPPPPSFPFFLIVIYLKFSFLIFSHFSSLPPLLVHLPLLTPLHDFATLSSPPPLPSYPLQHSTRPLHSSPLSSSSTSSSSSSYFLSFSYSSSMCPYQIRFQ
ncbi:hypothetical protein ACTXT7_016912 [Hymenolepis weldensis]